MFDAVARRYDAMNDIMTGGLVRKWRRRVLEIVAPKPEQRILDLAAGTGTSSLPLVASGATTYSTDISLGMLVVGKRRHPHLNFVAGDALALPYADNSFDAVTISYGLRNVVDTSGALREAFRVTKPGGKLVIAEASTPIFKPLAWVYRFYLAHILPKLQRFSSNGVAYDYLAESILAWPGQYQLRKLMESIGYTRVSWDNLLGGIVAIHKGKKPA